MATKRNDNVKEKILESAEKLLISEAQTLSLADIADAAGVSKGTLYYYFKTKDDLLLSLTDRLLSERKKALTAWASNPDKDTSLHRFVGYVMQYNTTDDHRLRLFYAAMSGNANVRERFLALYGEFSALLQTLIAARTDKMDAKFLSWAILLCCDGIIIQKNLANDGFDPEKFIDLCCRYSEKLEK